MRKKNFRKKIIAKTICPGNLKTDVEKKSTALQQKDEMSALRI